MRALARRPLLRLLTVLAAAPLPAVPTLLAATPAHADDSVAIPHMYWTVTVTSTYHKLCPVGYLSGGPAVAPSWTLLVDGARSDGGAIVASGSSRAQVSDVCVTVSKGVPTAAYGTYAATFTFVDLATEVNGDVPLSIALHATWRPGDPGAFAVVDAP